MANHRELSIWEGVGGLSLLGLGVSSIYSMSCLYALMRFWTNGLLTPENVHSNIQKLIGKEVYLQGVITKTQSPDTFQNIAYSYTIYEEKAVAAVSNVIEKIHVIQI